MAFWSNSTPENQAAYGGQTEPLKQAVEQVKQSQGQSQAKGGNGGTKQR